MKPQLPQHYDMCETCSLVMTTGAIPHPIDRVWEWRVEMMQYGYWRRTPGTPTDMDCICCMSAAPTVRLTCDHEQLLSDMDSIRDEEWHG